MLKILPETASRMESHGTPGSIQATERVRARLSDRHHLEPREPIEVVHAETEAGPASSAKRFAYPTAASQVTHRNSKVRVIV